MSIDDLAPQPQGRTSRSRLAWIWPIITHVLILSTIGFWISAFIAIAHAPHLQVIGSGWWQYGTMGIAGLLLALVGFSGKMSVLIAGRNSGLWGLRGATFVSFNTEVLGLGMFMSYGVLPLCIHAFSEPWIILSVWAVPLGFSLAKRIIPRLRSFAMTWLDDRYDAELLVADPFGMSRRTLISGGLILGIGASGLAAVWRALPTLIPDYTFFGHNDTVNSLSWFPDSLRIASISYHGQLIIWNADDGSNRRTLPSVVSTLTKVQVSPNGRLLAVSDGISIYTLDVTTGTALWNKDIGYSVRPFGWAPDSTHIVVNSLHNIRIVNALTGEEAATRFALPEGFSPEAVAWSPDKKSIAATDGVQIVLWDAASGVQRETTKLPYITSQDLGDFSLPPDGDALAVAVRSVVYVWSPNNAETPIAYREHSLDIPAISWSPDGRYIASCGSQDKTVRVWEAATGKTVFVYNGHFSYVEAVAWSPDGRRIASGGYDHLVHVWHPILPA